MIRLIVILHIASTLIMAGVIWYTQLIQYPAFSSVRTREFAAYHSRYTVRITRVVLPPMVIELITAILLLINAPAAIDHRLLWLGFVLTIFIWLSTFLLQVPLHNRLAGGFEAGVHASLVSSNWIRTVLWSLRGILVFYFAWQVVRV